MDTGPPPISTIQHQEVHTFVAMLIAAVGLCRKRNKWAREFSKRAPLLALVLLLALGGSLVGHSVRMRSLHRQLKTQLAAWEDTKAELLQQTVRSCP